MNLKGKSCWQRGWAQPLVPSPQQPCFCLVMVSFHTVLTGAFLPPWWHKVSEYFFSPVWYLFVSKQTSRSLWKICITKSQDFKKIFLHQNKLTLLFHFYLNCLKSPQRCLLEVSRKTHTGTQLSGESWEH